MIDELNAPFTVTTLAQVFQSIANALLTVEQFTYGASWENVQNFDLRYPNIFLEFPSLIQQTRGEKRISFAFYVLDRTLEGAPGQRNLIDNDSLAIQALTKCENIILDVLAIIRRDYPSLIDPGFTFTYTPVIEDFADRVYGYRVEIEAKARQTYSTCNTPELPILLPSGDCVGTAVGPCPPGIDCDELANCPIIIDILDDITVLNGSAASLQNQISVLNVDINTAQADILVLNGSVVDLQNQIDLIEIDVTNIFGDITIINGSVTSIQSEVDQLQLDVAAIKPRPWLAPAYQVDSNILYYAPATFNSVTVNTNSSIYYYLFVFGTDDPTQVSPTEFGILKTTNTTGTSFRYALYECNLSNYLPTTLIWDSGEVITNAIVQHMTPLTNVTLTPGQPYYLAYKNNATQAVGVYQTAFERTPFRYRVASAGATNIPQQTAPAGIGNTNVAFPPTASVNVPVSLVSNNRLVPIFKF